MPGEYTFYSGSRALLPLAEAMGLPVDRVNFVVSQVVSVPLALLYYRLLPPSSRNRQLRLLYPFLIALLILVFCFGLATKHILFDVMACYLIIRFAPVKYVHKLVFCVAMGYLSFIHFYRVYHTRTYLIDVTGPMMVVTQKVTSLAFSVHDGKIKKREDLTEIQKREMLPETPSLLEYLSYVFHFQSILCGPFCIFRDYIDFIDGKHLNKIKMTTMNGNANYFPKVQEPSPWPAVWKKFLVSAFCLFFAAFMSPFVSLEPLLTPPLSLYPLPVRLLYVHLSLFLCRTQYYYAWVIADAINNASGFGFNGFSSNGRPKWDSISNVRIWDFESANNWKECLEAWNCTTVHWLRRVGFERSPKRYQTIATYFLSAWWHGFFPGYYLTFLSGALFTEASRAVRRRIRPYFLYQGKFLYDCATFLGVKMAIAVTAFPFVMLNFQPSLQLHMNFYFFLHFLALFAVVGVPVLVPPKQKRA